MESSVQTGAWSATPKFATLQHHNAEPEVFMNPPLRRLTSYIHVPHETDCRADLASHGRTCILILSSVEAGHRPLAHMPIMACQQCFLVLQGQLSDTVVLQALSRKTCLHRSVRGREGTGL